MKANVNPDTCIGCELCTSVCPDVFKMEDDGLAHCIVDEVPTNAKACAQEASDSCPTSAISLS
ncbi:MAG: ferredoxin [Chitinispirillales bacterium]|jgi:ferredoxin|nr:ferredoxin [Chitinispirillales bacterium]